MNTKKLLIGTICFTCFISIEISPIYIHEAHASSWCANRGMPKWQFLKKLKLQAKKKIKIVGQANQSCCIVVDDSSGSAGTGAGASINQNLNEWTNGGCETVNLEGVNGDAGCAGGWSLLGQALADAQAANMEGGCHVVMASDGCSNHRNPYVRMMDQTLMNRTAEAMGGDPYTDFITIFLEGTMDPSVDIPDNGWGGPLFATYGNPGRIFQGIEDGNNVVKNAGAGSPSNDDINRYGAALNDRMSSNVPKRFP